MSRKLREEDKRRLAVLCESGQAVGIIRAIERGQKIVIVSNGRSDEEYSLMKFLDEIDVDYTDATRSHVIQFSTKRLGRGGERRAW